MKKVAVTSADTVFEYPLFHTQQHEEDDVADASHKIVKLETRQAGAISAARGVLATNGTATVLASSQCLPLFMSSLYTISQSKKGMVFHIASETLDKDLTVSNSYANVYSIQHTGAVLLNSATTQEAYDFAIAAQIAAIRLQKPIVHFYDSLSVASQYSKIAETDDELIQAALNEEKENQISLITPETSADLALELQNIFNNLYPLLRTHYKLYEYYGSNDAESVVVLIGEATAAFKDAVDFESMLGSKYGVLQVRAVQPWSHQLFKEALPATVKNVAVLENIPFSGTCHGALTRNVQSFFHSNLWYKESPFLLTGFYGGVSDQGGFTASMARATFSHLANTESRANFVVSKQGDGENKFGKDTPLVTGEGFSFSSDPYSKQFVFWGLHEPREDVSVHEVFSQNLKTLCANQQSNIQANIVDSALSQSKKPISTLQVKSSKTSSGLSHTVDEADVSIIYSEKILDQYDVVDNVKEGGALLIKSAWKLDGDVSVTPEIKNKIAEKQIRIFTCDVDDIAANTESEAISSYGLLIAFFKVSKLYPKAVVSALLKKEIGDKADSKTLDNFLNVIWNEVTPVVYPVDAWKEAEDQSEHEEGSEDEPLSAITEIKPSKVSLSKSNLKEPRAPVSTNTSASWKFVFPETFNTRQDLRAGVSALVRLTKWERLTPVDYSRNVFHLEMDIRGTGLKYSIGEALAVYAHNDRKDVLQFLRDYNFNPEDLVSMPVKAKKGSNVKEEETVTIYHLFCQMLDIFGRPSKKFYEALAHMVSDAEEKKTLEHLLSPEGKEDYKKRVDETVTYADLLKEFKSAKPTLQKLIEIIPRIKPRHYSIASSMKMNPDSVHLLVVLHDWKTPSGKYRVGQATRYLSNIKVGDYLSVSTCSSVMKLPVNHEDAVVMAGLGTGMAPFRAFIQERAYLKSQGVKVGPIALYFGSRSKSMEYLYGDELDAYHEDGLLTYLRCAFSRDQPHKIYIQDRIAEDKEVLNTLFMENNGHFYLCGPTWPVSDVRKALIDSFVSVGGMTEKQGNAEIEKMREEGRYVLEVY